MRFSRIFSLPCRRPTPSTRIAYTLPLHALYGPCQSSKRNRKKKHPKAKELNINDESSLYATHMPPAPPPPPPPTPPPPPPHTHNHHAHPPQGARAGGVFAGAQRAYRAHGKFKSSWGESPHATGWHGSLTRSRVRRLTTTAITTATSPTPAAHA